MSSDLDVLMKNTVEGMRVSLDTVTCGNCFRREEGGVENGLTSLLCSAVLWVVVHDGFGMPRIISGLRYTPNCKNDGSTSTPAKKLGTIRGYTVTDGASRCHTALHFRLKAQLTLPAVMYGIPDKLSSEIDVPRMCYCTS